MRVFVTGTDTGIGKTVTSAVLCAAFKASYWKPVQTGTDSDTEAVQALSGARVWPPRFHFPHPISPHAAASRAGTRILLSDFELPPRGPLVVEGAGGVMVPLNDHHTLLDLMVHLGLPVVVVASTRLGTINHTLLTLQALRGRSCPVLGVVLVGCPDPVARAAIEHHGKVQVLFELPHFEPLTARQVQDFAGGLHGF